MPFTDNISPRRLYSAPFEELNVCPRGGKCATGRIESSMLASSAASFKKEDKNDWQLAVVFSISCILITLANNQRIG